MRNIIIGTAGHIDHGKTTLIKALTGKDTDRLEEEKRRGITIDLGFAFFDLPDSKKVGIIDVPGHEKFIKNMLAGVVGMDLVLFVIAADEGIMPQTREHLSILNLLGVRKGIVVITKCDLVDDEWMLLVEEDIKEGLEDTFLQDSPIIKVSSSDGTGIEELTFRICELTKEIELRNINTIPRLPIDRVFTISGFGTVITGTLISGKLSKGDEVEIFPIGKYCKIRNIQVHGENNENVLAGQRAAINLTNIKKNELYRGCVIAPKNSMQNTLMIDVKLKLLHDSKRIIENRNRLHLYTGTSEVLCRVVLIDKEKLTPGEECYAQLRLEEELAVRRGDKFIIRFYSPLETIGGGTIIEPNPSKKKRFDKNAIEELRIKEKGSEWEVTEKIIKDNSKIIPNIKEIAKITATSLTEIEKHIDILEKECKITVFKLKSNIYVWHKQYEHTLEHEILRDLEVFHEKHPLRKGMRKAEIKSKYFNNIKPLLFDEIIEKMANKEIIKIIKEFISLKGYEIKYNDKHLKIQQDIIKLLNNYKYNLVKINELLEEIKISDVNERKDIVYLMFDNDILVKINEDIYMENGDVENAKKILVNDITENGSITAARFRDLLNTNRKSTILLLEYFDNIKLTKRKENERILF